MNMNNPYEENLQKPLEKYGRDITKAAKDGKIDPVIGRDEELEYFLVKLKITLY